MMARLWEYETHNGVIDYVATDINGVFWVSGDSGITWTNKGTIADPWAEMVNFKDKLYIFQDGGEPAQVWDGAVLAPYDAFNNVPVTGSNGISLSAFGRIWTVTDTHTIVYSALLDETDWDFANPTSDAGAIEHRHIWEGTDTIVALKEFNGNLIVFGRNNVVVWSDGEGSDHALDPLGMYVVDVIHGVGCNARDSVVELDGDMWWLSDSGIQSMQRVIEQRSNPMSNVSRHVHDDVLRIADNTDLKQVQALYSPEERFVLFTFPDASNGSESGRAFCFDSRGLMEDGSARCVGIWNKLVPKCMVRMQGEKEVMFFVGAAAPQSLVRSFVENVAGIYSGYTDPVANTADPIVPYQMKYESGWNNFESPYIKIPKRMRSVLYTLGETALSMSVWYDFDDFRFEVYNDPITTDQSPSFWTDPRDTGGAYAPAAPDSSEYNDNPEGVGVDDQTDPTDNVSPVKAGEYSGGYKPVILSVPSVRGTGEYIRVGVSGTIAGFPLSIQEVSLYLKQGRLI
jgi:hypothetical protein